ncbi:aminoglycoside phosphotransferase family protein [Streptomyces sp. NPDC000594]|uniref:phosphotransferase family protein n=1 Tax=Streptomyces sp. NPDC000594 TaxID=3154261 RepID=UPI00332373C7
MTAGQGPDDSGGLRLRPQPDIASRVPALRPVVEAALRTGPCRITPWRQGMDFAVLRAEVAGGRYALRIPLLETTRTSYDGYTDFAEVIAGEVALHRHLTDAGVPVPRLHGWGRRSGDVPSWMLMEYIEHDQVTALGTGQQRSLGRVARSLHALRPAPGPDLAALRTAGRAQALVRRALVRYRRAALHHPLPAPHLVEPVLRSACLAATGTRVLHMDLRPENLCFRGTRITALLDLSNALIGPPAAELGRLYAYGLLTPAFLEGYRQSPAATPTGAGVPALPSARVIRAHAVDTLACLVVLAAEELADPEMLRTQGDRLATVARSLLA